MVMLLAGLVLAVAGCTDGSSAQSGPVKATWIDAAVVGDTATIPEGAVYKYTNVHFNVPTQHGNLAYMAYVLDDEIFVRANVCPPCGSIGFTLDNGILVCDSCGTTFDATTGNGISGGCVAYPKESVPYTVTQSNIVMNIDDAIQAYAQTIQAG